MQIYTITNWNKNFQKQTFKNKSWRRRFKRPLNEGGFQLPKE